MPRYGIELTRQERDLVRKLADRDDRTMASMIRCIFRSGLKNLQVGKSTRNGANQRQISAESARNGVNQQREDPRARSSLSLSINKQERERQRAGARGGAEAPEPVAVNVDIGELTSQLNRTINALAGTRFLVQGDAAAERAVYHRLRGPCVGPVATVEQITELVEHYAEQWAGTRYASGLALRLLLDDRFWERHAKIGLPTDADKPDGPKVPTAAERMAAEQQRKAREAELADASAAQPSAPMTDEQEQRAAAYRRRYAQKGAE